MTPRPFYRSRLFWLGLPGLVFLLWGWWFSNRYASTMMCGDGERFWWIGQSPGELSAVWDSDGLPERGALFEVQHTNVKPVVTVGRRDRLAELAALDSTYRYVIIPYYAVVLAYVAAWLTLTWWQRRKSRLMRLPFLPTP